MALWRVDLHALNNAVPLLSNIAVRDQQFSFGYVLNGPGSFNADLILTHVDSTEANFAEGARELRVYRDNVLVWGGYLWRVEAQLPDALQIVGQGYHSRLRRRFVMTDLIYITTAQEAIARGLVDHTQAQPSGSMGITTTLAGNHTGASVARDRNYCSADSPNIAAGIDELAGLDDGLDFEITPSPTSSANKVLKTYSPRKGTTVAVTIDKFLALDYQSDASDVVSRTFARGDGDCSPPTDDRSDATALASYGLLQDAITVDSDKLTDVQGANREVLRNRKTPRRNATVTFHEAQGPAFGTYGVGDIVTLVAAKGYMSFSRQMRVITLDVQIRGNNKATYTLGLDSVVA